MWQLSRTSSVSHKVEQIVFVGIVIRSVLLQSLYSTLLLSHLGAITTTQMLSPTCVRDCAAIVREAITDSAMATMKSIATIECL